MFIWKLNGKHSRKVTKAQDSKMPKKWTSAITTEIAQTFPILSPNPTNNHSRWIFKKPLPHRTQTSGELSALHLLWIALYCSSPLVAISFPFLILSSLLLTFRSLSSFSAFSSWPQVRLHRWWWMPLHHPLSSSCGSAPPSLFVERQRASEQQHFLQHYSLQPLP